MSTIPDYQLTPPAGHHDAIAFRPACSQLMSRLVDGQTEWFVTLPTGADYVLYKTPPQPVTEAHAALDASGICKTGGVDVPIVAPGQAVTTDPVMVELIPAEVTQTAWLPIIGIVLGAVVVGTALLWHIRQNESDDIPDWVRG